MAGKDRTITGQRARHNLAAVAFLCCLFTCVFLADPAWADYAVTSMNGETIRTHSYWIQGKMMYFSEGIAPVSVYDVKAVTAEKLTKAQAREHEAAMQGFRTQMEALSLREKAVTETLEAYLAEISPASPAQKGPDLTKQEKKVSRAELKVLQKDVVNLENDWRQAMLPDFSLLIVRDIKLLQLLSLHASVQQTLKYLQTGDPTPLAYANADLKQAASFNDTFQSALPWK